MILKRWLQRLFAGEEKKVRCAGCGTCCELFGGHLQASRADLQRWQEHGRTDLLARVNRLGWIWVDPESKQPESRCPFLERTSPESARCAIHAIKPDICRAYPTLAHGRRCVRGLLLQLPLLLANSLPSVSARVAELPPQLLELACML